MRRPGSRGRLPKRCEGCRLVPVVRPAPRGSVENALQAELRGMPERVRTSTEAAAARALAVQVDQGLSMTAATRELTRVVALLRKMASEQEPPAAPEKPAGEVPKGVADIAARAAARRAQAAG